MEAFCEHYGINVDQKVSQLSQSELHTLLYADDQIRFKLSYKEGKRRKQHYVVLRGAIPDHPERTSGGSPSEPSVVYSKYMEEVPCHVCGGAKLRQNILEYKVGGLSYDEVERMELTSLYSWLQRFNDSWVTPAKKELSSQLVEGMLRKLEALIQLNVGYLCLSRSIPTLSGGERQRIRIATQLTCSLNGFNLYP